MSPKRPRRLIAGCVAFLVACTGPLAAAGGAGFRDEMRQAVEEAEREMAPAPVPVPAFPATETPVAPPATVPADSATTAPSPAEPTRPSGGAAPGHLLPSPLVQPALVVPSPAEEVAAGLGDPLEVVNRAVMVVNLYAMRYLFDPLVDFFRRHVSLSGQRAVVNVFRNLREPVNLAAAILQWEWTDAQIVLSRFVVNSTLGIAGLVDQASVLGFHPRTRTVDQALCRWGAGPGPYLVLPLLGPSSLRDTVARAGVLGVQALVVGVWVIPYRVADFLAQYTVTRDTWEAMMLDQPLGYERLRAVYELYTEVPCSARNAADNGLFFQ